MRMHNLKQPNFGKSISKLLSTIGKENSGLEDRIKGANPHEEESNTNAAILEDFGLMDGDIEKNINGRFSEEAKIFDPEKSSIDLGEKSGLNKAIDIIDNGYNVEKEKVPKLDNSSVSGLLNRVGDLNLSGIGKNKDFMELSEHQEVQDIDYSHFENEHILDLLVGMSERPNDWNHLMQEKNELLNQKLHNQSDTKGHFDEDLSKIEKNGSKMMINQSCDKLGEEDSKLLKTEESFRNILTIINPEQPVDISSKLDLSGSLRRSVPKLDLSRLHENKKRITSNPNNSSVHLVVAEGATNAKENPINLNEPFFPNGLLDFSDDDENKKTEKPNYGKKVHYFGSVGNPIIEEKQPLQPQGSFNKTPVKFNTRAHDEALQNTGANTGKKSHGGNKSMDSYYSPISQQVGFIRHAHSQRQGEGVNVVSGSSQNNILGGTKDPAGSYAHYFPNLNVHQSQVMPRPPSLPRKRYHAKHSSSILEEPITHDSGLSFENSKLSVYKPDLVKNKPTLGDGSGPSGDSDFLKHASKNKEIPTRARSVSNHDSNFMVQGYHQGNSHTHTKSLNMRQSHDVLNNYNSRTFHYSRGEANDSRIDEISRDNSADKHNYKFYQYYADSGHKFEKDDTVTKYGTGKYFQTAHAASFRNGSNGQGNSGFGLNNSGRLPISSALSTSAINTAVLSAKKSENGLDHLHYERQEFIEETKGIHVDSKNKSRTLPYQKSANNSRDFERASGMNPHDSSKENTWRYDLDGNHGQEPSFSIEEKSKNRTKSSTVASNFAKIVSGNKIPLSQERVSSRLPSTQATFTRNSQNSRSPVVKDYSPMRKELTESKILQSTGNTSQILNSPEKDGARAMQANFRSKRFKDAKKA